MKIEEIPDGLHALQLAGKICEDSLGFPATQGNLTLIADCITAVGKKLFRSRPDEVKLACYWLNRRIETAQQNGEKITTHWLRNGEYWGVEKPDRISGPPKYEHHGQGYNEEDMKYLWNLYKAKSDSLPNRQMTDSEVEILMQELDRKRGKVPAFRHLSDVSHA